jgi:uncharacterized alkaline shock family protein YloU
MSEKERKTKNTAPQDQSAENAATRDCTSIATESGGVIQIANDVVSNIAGLAVMEVEGVSKLTGNITKELITKLGRKSLSKGIRLDFSGNELKVDVSIEVKFGYNIVNVSKNVQDRVRSNINTMTGLKVNMVNVRVSGIDTASGEK